MKKIITASFISIFLIFGIGSVEIYAACPAGQTNLGCGASNGSEQCGLTFRGCKTSAGTLNCVSDTSCQNSAPGGSVGVGKKSSIDQSPINGSCGTDSIDTAIGCIPIGNQNALIGFFLRWGIGIGGGIAFLLILMAGFQIMTSRGDPKRLQAGQELMTSAISGLLLLIFSLVILRIIGFDIFNITAFK